MNKKLLAAAVAAAVVAAPAAFAESTVYGKMHTSIDAIDYETFNEDNYDVNPDGTLTIRYPWLGITFYGPNRLIANALDDNLYDFIRSQSVQQGGSTFAPGEIPNPLARVNGAHGVFGSYARVSFDLFVIRPEGF